LLCGSKDRDDELVQDTVISLGAISTISGGHEHGAWLFTICAIVSAPDYRK